MWRCKVSSFWAGFYRGFQIDHPLEDWQTEMCVLLCAFPRLFPRHTGFRMLHKCLSLSLHVLRILLQWWMEFSNYFAQSFTKSCSLVWKVSSQMEENSVPNNRVSHLSVCGRNHPGQVFGWWHWSWRRWEYRMILRASGDLVWSCLWLTSQT